jgi:hypothetical protein
VLTIGVDTLLTIFYRGLMSFRPVKIEATSEPGAPREMGASLSEMMRPPDQSGGQSFPVERIHRGKGETASQLKTFMSLIDRSEHAVM